MVCCTRHEFTCANGRCIDIMHVCNRVDDCNDGTENGTDETRCYGECIWRKEFKTVSKDNMGGHFCHDHCFLPLK